MSIEVLVSIVGAFGVVALSINAFFLKGIYSELNIVKIQIASIISGSDFIRKEIERVERESQNEHLMHRKKHHEIANEIMSIKLKIQRLEK